MPLESRPECTTPALARHPSSFCLAGSDEPSHVIDALKPDTAASRQMIRFSIDPATTREQIKSVVTAVKRQAEAFSGVLSPK